MNTPRWYERPDRWTIDDEEQPTPDIQAGYAESADLDARADRGEMFDFSCQHCGATDWHIRQGRVWCLNCEQVAT